MNENTHEKAMEEGIEDDVKRILRREDEVNEELVDLAKKLVVFEWVAWFLVAAGAIVGIYGMVKYAQVSLPIDGILDDSYGLNLLGDYMSGTVASVWSLSGLFFIYIAFLGQKQQLLNQELEVLYSRLEIKYTRVELQGQKEEMSIQNQTLQLQKFESTYFQLVSLYTQTVAAFDLEKDEYEMLGIESEVVPLTGKDCFKEYHGELRAQILRNIKTDNPDYGNKVLPDIDLNSILTAYVQVFKKNQNDLGHYFRQLYHIIQFVERSSLTPEEKVFYVKVLRAQLSSFELSILFYNCLSHYGLEKFKPLIEKYSFFKNLEDELLWNLDHKEKYATSAY